MDKELRIEQKLSSDRQPVKIGDEVSGLLLKDKDVIIEGSSEVGGDLSIGGELTGELQINTDGTHIKLVAAADPVDDYATIAVADTGDLTITTVGDGSKDSDLLLNVDGCTQINTQRASIGNLVIYEDGTSILGGDQRLTLVCSDTTVSLTLYSPENTSNMAIFRVDTDGDSAINVTGDLELNSDSGVVSLKDDTVAMAIISAGRIDTHYDASNYTRIGTSSAGVCTISTIGGTPANADFIVDAGGDIALDSGTGIFIAKNAGTEFSAANSAYAGMILGYTRLEGDLTSSVSFELQNALTVEDSTHQITFKTPPSELVEIEATFLINAVSTDTRITVGLSDNSTYNAVAEQFEYDGSGIAFGDDEIDDGVRTVKFVLGASHLASVGSSNTFYIGFSTSGVTKTAYLGYGLRASHSIADHPFVIKATALPATIYDGL